MKQSPQIKEHHTYRDIYAFDSTTSVMLSELSSTPSADSTLTIHTHYPYAFYRPHHLRFQIAVLALSLLKSLEIYTLFLLGGTLVGTLSGPSSFLFSHMIGFLHHHTRPSTSFVFSRFANSKIYSDTKRTLFVLTIEKVELVQLVLLEKELWNSKAPWVSEFLETSKISIVRCMTYHLTTSSPGALGAGQPS